MHFGKLVKSTAENYKISVDEMAFLMDKTEKEVAALYKTEDWTSRNIKNASEALNYDFGTYLNRSVEYDFVKQAAEVKYHEMLISIKYPVGKENKLEAWLERMWLMAQSIGLEAEQ